MNYLSWQSGARKRASEPDRALDAEIAVALDLEGECMSPSRFRLLHRDYGGNNSYAAIGKHHPRLPAFTASLDAAMKLVPEGSIFAVANSRVSSPEQAEGASAVCGLPNSNDKHVEAAAPALALCAAALRARASMTPSPAIGSPLPDTMERVK